MSKLGHSKLAAVLALIVTLTGLVTSPVVLDLIPPQWAGVITAVGALAQAITRAITPEK